MNGNTIGTIFRVTTWGESHGPALGAVIDGCPSGLPLAEGDFCADLARRQGGQGNFSTPRKESDTTQIESGVFEGRTTGTPIALRIENSNQQSSDYEAYRNTPRPGHADLTTSLKHEHRDHRGGGRASARETTARVAAGVVAKKILRHLNVQVVAWVERAGVMVPTEIEKSTWEQKSLPDLQQSRDASPLACPFASSLEWKNEIESLRTKGESLGGAIRCRVEGLPVGIGEPIFDKLGAVLGHSLMSLPAAVAFEAGGGLAMSYLPGSQIRDAIQTTESGPRPSSNRHGGLLGGMSTGCPLFLSIAFHAPTSIPQPIESVDIHSSEKVEVVVRGRHDAFPLPRAVPMVEAMVAMTLVDQLMRAGQIPESL